MKNENNGRRVDWAILDLNSIFEENFFNEETFNYCQCVSIGILCFLSTWKTTTEALLRKLILTSPLRDFIKSLYEESLLRDLRDPGVFYNTNHTSLKLPLIK